MDTTKTQYGKSLVKCRRITFRFRSRGLKLCNRLITVRVRLGLTGMRVSGDSLKSFREFAPVFVVLASQFLATTSSERPCKTKKPSGNSTDGSYGQKTAAVLNAAAVVLFAQSATRTSACADTIRRNITSG